MLEKRFNRLHTYIANVEVVSETKLDITYIVEEEYAIRQITLRGVNLLDIFPGDITISRDSEDGYDPYILTGDRARITGGIENEIIKEYAEELTLEEIEKKFGHKVKIVSNKEEN